MSMSDYHLGMTSLGDLDSLAPEADTPGHIRPLGEGLHLHSRLVTLNCCTVALHASLVTLPFPVPFSLVINTQKSCIPCIAELLAADVVSEGCCGGH